jgi:hypothetical protein
MHSKGTPVTGPMFEKAQSFYDKIMSKITDKCTFFKSRKRIPCRNLGQYRRCLIIWQPSGLVGVGLEEF